MRPPRPVPSAPRRRRAPRLRSAGAALVLAALLPSTATARPHPGPHGPGLGMVLVLPPPAPPTRTVPDTVQKRQTLTVDGEQAVVRRFRWMRLRHGLERVAVLDFADGHVEDARLVPVLATAAPPAGR